MKQEVNAGSLQNLDKKSMMVSKTERRNSSWKITSLDSKRMSTMCSLGSQPVSVLSTKKNSMTFEHL